LGIAFTVMTVAILAFFAATLGVRISLTAKSSVRAMGWALGIGLFVGGMYLACGCPFAWLGAMMGPNEEIILIGFAPCVPMLLSLPNMATMPNELHREAFPMLIAYVLGVGGYAIAGGWLYRSAINRFDTCSGRTRMQGTG